MPNGGKLMNLRSLIIDDEDLARLLLRQYAERAGGIDLLAECSNGFDAVKAITELKPDLVFLDVQMPKLNGFEVLELVDVPPAVIFVTAHDQYAMRAFDAHAVDYLLKPFHFDRFAEALDHARNRLGQSLPPAAKLMAAARPPDRWLERIVIREGSRVLILPVDKLDFVHAEDDYVSFRMDNKSHLKQQTISDVETQLDPARFVRVHRSYIVNVDRILRIEPYTRDSRVAILRDGSKIPLSRSGLARLKAVLGENV
jgi:two-component system, LytTR family, response regulator